LLRAGRTRYNCAGDCEVKTLWLILAGVGGLLAAVFVLRGDFEKAFVAAAAGAVCWILNYRWQLRESLASQEEDNQEDEDEETGS
jgi:hypothetical protein